MKDIVNSSESEILDMRVTLLASLLDFTKIFYQIRTGREFKLSHPTSRESHYITISRELTSVFYGQSTRLQINIPPRYGKTEMLINFVAWAMARYPDCNFIYVSSSKELATIATSQIHSIMNLPAYQKIFGVTVSDGKSRFETNYGGIVDAVGPSGTVTGKGAGIKGVTGRFSGAGIIDDIIQAADAFSDVVREGANIWYYQSFISRMNNPSNTPIIALGQKLHEHDFFGFINGKEPKSWRKIILKALDDAGNALDPSMHTKEDLLKLKELERYTYWSQYQQTPLPPGGGIFKRNYFKFFEQTPKILSTFITVDTAETANTANDATVFSFFGLYRIKQFEQETDLYGIHWLNSWEIWVEPKDLESQFMDFYASCMQNPVKPQFAAIEKKSTGITLTSTLSEIQGIRIVDIPRTAASKNKAVRYIEMQPFIAKKLITFTIGAKHAKMCIDHCEKITLNNTHLRDDIADTLYDAVKAALIDKTLIYLNRSATSGGVKKIQEQIIKQASQLDRLRRDRNGRTNAFR